jgi:hypothetical protein
VGTANVRPFERVPALDIIAITFTGMDLGPGGRMTWTRDDLHER